MTWCVTYIYAKKAKVLRSSVVSAMLGYFCSVGKKLAAKFDLASSNDYQNFLTKRIIFSMYFSPTTECQVFDAIKQLNSSKSSGFDGISPKFSRITADILASVLEKLFHACFECGFFSNTLKIAKVIQQFKTDDKTN